MAEVSHDRPAVVTDPPTRGVSLRRRLLAVASIVLTPLGAAMVLYGFLHGLPDLIYAIVALALAGGCVWVGLGHRGPRRWATLLLAAALVVLALVLVLTSNRQVLWIVIGAAVLGAGGSAAGAALLHAPRLDGRSRTRAGRRPRRPVLFVNPRSGDGTAERVGLVAEARQRGITVVELGPDDDLVELVAAAVRDGADCLGAAGGDGTLAVVAEAAIGADLPFVCIPAGTRNHFALDLGLDRSDPVGALDAFVDAYKKRIDVAEVNGRMFLNNVSVGAYGEVVADEQYRANKIGTALSKLPELIGPESEPLDLRFVDGDGQHHDTAVVVHVSNNSYELTPRPGFGTRPSLTDGRLGIVVVVRGPSITGPVRVLRWEAPTFRLDSGTPVAAGLDGEAVELETPVEFRIRSRVLRVRIPVHAVGVSPAAMRPRLSKRTVVRLVSLAAGRVPA